MGEEEARSRRIGCKEQEKLLYLVTSGTRPQVEADRGEERFKECWRKEGT